jgi:hypothetical protein
MGMNTSNFVHAGIAAILAILVYFLSGNWLAGACFGSAIFIGREHAQREYKIGDPSKLIGYEALDFWRWSLDAKLDLIMPIAAVAFIYIIGVHYA